MRRNEVKIELSSGKNILFYQSITDANDRRVHEHHHAEIELSLCCTGSGIYTINGRQYTMAPNDVIILAGDEPHYFIKISDNEPLTMFNLRFDPMLLWSENELVWLIRFFIDPACRHKNKIEAYHPAAEQIRSLFIKIHNEITKKKSGYELMVKMLVVNILIIIDRLYPDTSASYRLDGFSNTFNQLEKAIVFINENIENNITLDMIAQTVSMNKTYFSTIFKKFNGISLWDYITIKRVDRAVELLKTTNLTKIDIALKCGFNSSANFYKSFKRITGKNPSFFTQNNKK